MKRLTAFCCVILWLGCQAPSQTQTTLSDDQMSQIMADLYVAEAATTGMSGYPKDSLMKVYYLQAFEIHGTTPDIYEKDMKTVSQDMNRLKEIVANAQKILDGSANNNK